MLTSNFEHVLLMLFSLQGEIFSLQVFALMRQGTKQLAAGLQRILNDGLGFALPVEDVDFANCGRLHPMILCADDRTHCMQFVMLGYTHV